jgi:uncharacterized membrane protein
MPETYTKKNYRIIYTLACFVSACIYISLAFKKTIWMDEAYTFGLIRNSFSFIWEKTAQDVHPPLYYFLLKIFTMPFGYNLFMARIF